VETSNLAKIMIGLLPELNSSNMLQNIILKSITFLLEELIF
jgi:hypothetical protein